MQQASPETMILPSVPVKPVADRVEERPFLGGS